MSSAVHKKHIDNLKAILEQILETSGEADVELFGVDVGDAEASWKLKIDVWSLPGDDPDVDLGDAKQFDQKLVVVKNSLQDTLTMINTGISSGYDSESFYRNTLAPQVEALLKSLNAARDPGDGANFWGNEELIKEYFDPWPTNNLFSLLDGLLVSEVVDGEHASPAIAFLHSVGMQVNVSKDIRSTPETTAPGTSIIKSDIELELSLLERGISVGEYYIGFNLSPSFSRVHGPPDEDFPGKIGPRWKSYIPVRVSPYNQKTGGLPDGWDDKNYQLIDETGNLVPGSAGGTGPKTDYSAGVEFPLGMTVYVTEFISSATGMWVGFVPIFEGQGTEDEEDTDLGKTVSRTTKKYRRILYTRPEFLRKKESSVNTTPDPLLKLNLATNAYEEKFGPKDLQTSPYAKNKQSFKKVFNNGHLSYDWTTMRPMDVQLSYFNFDEYNKAEAEYVTKKPLLLRPGAGWTASMGKEYAIGGLKKTHKFSEGYYYFIVGEELNAQGGLRGKMGQAGYEVPESIVNKTFDDLLRYLGKDPSDTSTTPGNLLASLKRQYFAPVSQRAQTSGVDAGKIQVLFAIPAAYVDSLPDSKRPYFDNFSLNSEFAGGNNFSFNFYINDYQDQIDKLIKTFEKYKNKVESFKNSGGDIRDPYDLPYDIDQQIKAIKNFPAKLNGFLQRQWSPYNTEQDKLNKIISKSYWQLNPGEVAHEHIIQIGLRDNGEVGDNARLTISYVLFSPDPKSLKNIDDTDINLFDFDPYYGDNNQQATTMIAPSARKKSRSAVILRRGLSYFRNEVGDIAVSVSEAESEEQSDSSAPAGAILKTSSVLGTRTLNYLMSCGAGFTKALDRADGDQDKPWLTELARYSVPPLSIFTSKRKDFVEEDVDCEALLKRINEMSTQLSTDDRKIQEQFYNNPECMAMYFKQYGAPTPAVGPQSSRSDIERRQKEMEESDGIAVQKLMILYRGFLNNLDPQSLLSLLMSCLQSKFGLPITAEAVCEAIIVKAIESDPAGFRDAIMTGNPGLAAALGFSPNQGLTDRIDKNLDTILGEQRNQGAPDPITGEVQFSETDGLKIDESYDGAPIATGFLFFGADTYEANIIKNLEKGGTSIDLEPGAVRPPTYDSAGNLIRYSYGDIEVERSRLRQSGYTRTEADALMVQNGFLVPVEKQYKSLTNSILDPMEDLAGAFRGLGDGQAVIYGTEADYDGLQAFVDDARGWLSWAKRVTDLGQICEAFLGPVFNLPRDLLRGEGFNSSYYENYWQNLQKMFAFPTPKMDMSDKLKTDSFMGDYGNQLLDMFLVMIGTMLGQILNLVLRHYLQTCFESDEEEVEGAALPRPASSELLPKLRNIAGLAPGGSLFLPANDGISPNQLMRWLTELIENLSSGQLCALLKAQASDSLLRRCIDFTKVNHVNIYESGINTGPQVQAIFSTIAQEIDLDICDTIQGAQVVAAENLCYKSSYDSSARIIELMETGMDEQQARDQFKRELEDLRGTIKDLADLLYPNSNILQNSMPDMCSPGGAFSLPAGIKDTMSRVTDNILQNVEGSLIKDLSVLKFFSLPSRALLAQADTGEMLKSHEIFNDVVGEPYRQDCFAFVGPQWMRNNTYGGNEYGIKYYAINYGLAYNEFMHYKLALATIKGKHKQILYKEMDDDGIGGSGVLGAEDTSHIKPIDQFNLTYAECMRRAVTNNPVTTFFGEESTNRPPPDIFQHKEFKPMLVTEFLKEFSTPTLWAGQGMPLPEINAPGFTDRSRIFFNKYKKNYNTLGPYLEQVRREMDASKIDLRNYNVRYAVRDMIYQEMDSDVKPDNLDNLVYTTAMLFDSYNTRPHNSGLQSFRYPVGGSFGLDAAPGMPHTEFVGGASAEPDITNYIDSNAEMMQGTQDLEGKERRYLYRKSYPLSTKLVDINPSPVWWLGMLRLFTGAQIKWNYKYNPEERDDLDETDKDFIWRSTNPGIEFLTGEASYPGHGRGMLHTFVIGEDDDGDPITHSLTIGNLMWAFMNLDLGTASGITEERVQLLYPNMKGVGNIENVLLTATHAVTVCNKGEVTLDEEAIETIQKSYADRFALGDYDLYTAAKERSDTIAAKKAELEPLMDAMDVAEAAYDSAVAAAVIGGVGVFTGNVAYGAALKTLAEATIVYELAKEAYNLALTAYNNFIEESFKTVFLNDDVFTHFTSAHPSETVNKAHELKFYPEDHPMHPFGITPYWAIHAKLRERMEVLEHMFSVLDTYVESGVLVDAEHGFTGTNSDQVPGNPDLQLMGAYSDKIHDELFAPFYDIHPKTSEIDAFTGISGLFPDLKSYLIYHPQIVPLAITFKKQFKDPNSIFEDAEYFEMGNELVNKHLYNKLQDPEVFPTYMGFDGKGISYYRNMTSNTFSLEQIKEPPTYRNFNPNLLKYTLPEEQKKVLSYDQSGIAKQIDDIFSDLTTVDPDGQITALSDSITEMTSDREIVYQNSVLEAPDLYPNLKDSYQFLKCKLNWRAVESIPPDMLHANDPAVPILSAGYNFGFNRNFPEDVANLLQDIYNSSSPSASEQENQQNTPYRTIITEDFKKVIVQVLSSTNNMSDVLPEKLDGEPDTHRNYLPNTREIAEKNSRAAIFGKLLRTKFEQTYNTYATRTANRSVLPHAPGTTINLDQNQGLGNSAYGYTSPSADTVKNFMDKIQYNLTTYGFSGLQFAYSNQMFAKLKSSRIHRRKWLRKLWDKILSTPQSRGEGSRVDPACQDLFNKLAITSTKDMKSTDTDFFNISLVKRHIMEYYEDAICKDVFEASPQGESAVKNSLLQGIILLIVKIYTLEMCLASVIAWDSFYLSNIFEDEILIKIIIQNISQDVENMNLLARHAKDIVKNKNELSYFESWKSLTDSSALAYLIKSESKTISAIVDEIFSQSSRLTTDLTLDKITNSDPDFVSQYRRKFESEGYNPDLYTVSEGESITSIAYSKDFEVAVLKAANPNKNLNNLEPGDVIRLPRRFGGALLIDEAEILRSLYTIYGYEIVSDAKLNNNPYTLNYGYSYKNQNNNFKDLTGFEEVNSNLDNAIDHDLTSTYQKRYESKQRDYFYSLPTRPIYKDKIGDLSNKTFRPEAWYSNGQPPKSREYQQKAERFLNQNIWKKVEAANPESVRDVRFSAMFKGFSPYDKENIHEVTTGNSINAQIGNFIIQPFVKVVEQENLEQFKFFEYVDPVTGLVCAEPGEKIEYDPTEHLPVLTVYREGLMDPPVYQVKDGLEFLGDNVAGANPWSCHLYGYIPLNIWSDFYSNKLLKEIHNNEILTKFFDRFGLRPFFESIEIGFRLTYVGSAVVDNSPAIGFADFMNDHVTRRGLHECKSLISNRMYGIAGYGVNDTMISNEIHIPIVEVGRKLIFDRGGFRYETDHSHGDPRPYEELGFYSTFDKNSIVSDWTVLGHDAIIDQMAEKYGGNDGMNGFIKHASNNFSQLFYKHHASTLLSELQETAEFKLLFDYIFPMKRYMSLAFLYCGDSISKFISEPTKILQQSKSALNMVFEGLANSDRFEYAPDPLAPGGMELGDMGDTRGQDPSLEQQILMILLKTPLMILKGFVEVTDPAIIIAKAIIDIANAIQQAIIGAIESALKAVKSGIQSAIDQAKSSMIEIEINANSVSSIITSTKDNSLPAWKALVEDGWEDEDIDKALQIDTSSDNVEEWKFKVRKGDVPGPVQADESYKNWLEQVDAAKDLIDSYKEAAGSINQLEQQLADVEKDIEEKVTKAKQVMKDIFSSPWLLPGLWLALIPSQLPYLGGVVPAPIIVGPPSTIPGMIYLALLFIDAWEEKQHEQSKSGLVGEDGVNCENEL